MDSDGTTNGITEDAGERQETPTVSIEEHEELELKMETQLTDIAKTVKLLEKFQWISNGIAIAVVVMGGYIWNTTNNRINEITANFREEIKTELIVESVQTDMVSLRKSFIDSGTLTSSNQARIDQLEKDMIKLSGSRGR